MLDNTTMAATMPIEILADAKVFKIKQKQNSEDKLQITATNQTKTNKTKTILNWLKNTTTTTTKNNNLTDDNIEINSCNHNQFDKVIRQQQPLKKQQTAEKLATPSLDVNDCTCPTVKQQNSTRSIKSSLPISRDDDSLHEFRGVQTLKHFWNKRITANKESALKNKGCKHPNKQFTKSVSCLVNIINNTGEPPPLSEEERLKVRKSRAISLHDCSRLTRDDSIEFHEINLTDIEIQKHLEKDNFYKYKTAEQALKLRELSEHSTERKLNNGIIVPKVERLHWLKRHDIFNKRKTVEDSLFTSASYHSKDIMKQDSNNSKLFNISDSKDYELIISATYNVLPANSNDDDIVINEHNNMYTKQDCLTLPTAVSQTNINNNDVGNTTPGSESSTPTVTATNSPQHAISRTQLTTRKDSSKTLTSASSISRDSSTTSLTTSSGQRTNVKRNSSTRKYSFKTHSRSYHAPRKMHTNKDHAVTTTGQVNTPSNSLVAKLTQQFNEIIQKDKTLLEEIKRKNGVIMTHKGHVYKVVDTSSLNRSQSPSVSRSSSKAQDKNTTEKSTLERTRSSGSTVQKNIKKFESESRGLKPKVPLKSIHVLKKSNELVFNKLGAGNHITSNRSLHKQKDTETKTEVKPQTLNIPSTLEMVQEEAKTPVENKEISQEEKLENSKQDGYSKEIKLNRIESTTKEVATEIPDNLIDPNVKISTPPKLESVVYKSILKRKENSDLKQHASETLIAKPLALETLGKDISENCITKTESEIFKTLENVKDTPNNSYENTTSPITEISNSPSKVKQPTVEEENCIQMKEELSLKENQQQNILDNENKENKITATESIQKTQLTDNENINNSKELKFSKNEQRDPPTQTLMAKDLGNTPRELATKVLSTNNLNASPATKNIESQPSQDYDDEKKRKSKHKYSKIYEKLRIVNPFAHSNKKQKFTNPNSSDLNKSAETPQQEKSKTLPLSPYTPTSSPKLKSRPSSMDNYSIMYNSEAKLLDALEEVDKKLQNLNQDNVNEMESNMVVLESDEYGQPIKPNTSFLHQIYAKEVIPKPATIIQAVNVTLVNAIEGEQMILEQKEIQQEEENGTFENETSIAGKEEDEEEEPLYEPICTVKLDYVKTEESHNPSIETYKISEDSLSIDLSSKDVDLVEEDIYQTVEEVKGDYSHLVLQSPEIVINSLSELDGYEPIENPNDSALSVTTTQKIIHFDGYEECTPPVDITPITPIILGVRKVTDELPDLPQPKRILPKSPIPIRTAPKPPLPLKHPHLEEEEDESIISPSQESHYEFGGDENIYDTIKGSHCYESLHSMNNKLQNCPLSSSSNKNSDSVSLSSNCYESISNYKRTTIISHHSGSSNGSTLTISSDNRTNSLYDGSLPYSLHYSSKRIYRSNTHTPTEINNKTTDVSSGVNGYGTGSIGRTSDTSDEWTDVTDNENGDDAECSKPQFIIVRERSKAHKSPDWSKRVRERQRKSKSCIEEDDPDHYYEQLSPQALSKRYSLLEQSRANSLQRNQESIRVSKRSKQMSYSAHALGQHISDDSFDSDTDDNYEKGHFKNSHNDSGVDIPTKLPEPPSSSNQMYSIVKKFKNFIVNKKSPNSSKHGGSQQKIYDNSSQFYVNGQFEGKSSSLQVPETKELSTSEKNLIMAQSTVSKPDALNTSTTPRKSKSGKSLKSRIRKSLVGFDNKQLSTLTPTRSTFYIEDPVPDDNNGQMDSGFSEKALSGDLPTTAPSTESHKFATLARKAKKEAKLANSQRRRTTIGIRPHEPPPPPPPAESTSKIKRQSNTSWYAECGVFKNGTTNLVHDDSQILNSQTGGSGSSFTAGSTWYEEAGLYQTSGISVASSSGSSGVSTSNETGPADEMSHSMFSNEPLYQIYSAAKLEAISRDMQDESSTDGYEEIGDRLRNGSAVEGNRKSSRPSALQLIEPKSGPERTLWSQIPEVINSFIIPTMTQRERSLMEAKFEVITSEASYLKSLNLLRTHYMNHPVFRDQNIVSSRDRKFLFAHIVPVHECSEKLLTELESCWQDNIMLLGLSKRIYAIAEKHFHVYVGFCEHQGRMDRTLKRLREGKGLFSQNLELLESSPSCCGLNLHSFLMLPMQRITRLPLLIDAVFSKCHPNDDEYENWKMCLAIMNKVVTQCNEAANKSEQAFEIERISRQLEFNPSSIRPLAIAPAGVMAPGTKPRYLVKKGELTHLIWRGDDAKLTFGKKFSKTTVFAFLFSDLLVLTKRKAEEHFSVFDYCPRNMLTITSGDTLPQLPTKDLNSQTSKNLILMTLLENHERKTVELLLSCPSVSEQERWLQAMRPPESETPGEKLYEQWDCPQVIAKHLYENNEPDVLNLEVGDVVNVTRKLPDGWYKGERIRDGAVGWFPGSYTEEVNSVHVRARNLKQRHRLLTFTATYLESQKRNK